MTVNNSERGKESGERERERERGCKEARISFIETSGRFPNVGDNTSGEIQVWCIALGSIIIINDYVAVVVVVVVSASSNIVAHSHSHRRGYSFFYKVRN